MCCYFILLYCVVSIFTLLTNLLVKSFFFCCCFVGAVRNRSRKGILRTNGRVTGHWWQWILLASTASLTPLNLVTEVGIPPLLMDGYTFIHVFTQFFKLEINTGMKYSHLMLRHSFSSVRPVAPTNLFVPVSAWNATVLWQWEYNSYSSLALVCQVELNSHGYKTMVSWVCCLCLCLLVHTECPLCFLVSP